ncbi:MAG: hypothetical protein ABI609_08745 [Acidobacteriota bacterium]
MRQTLRVFMLLCAIGALVPVPTQATPGDTCAAATFELGLLPISDIDTTIGRNDTNSHGGPCADGSTGVAGSAVGADLYYRIRPSASCTLQVTMNPVGTTPVKNLGLYIASDCAPLTASNCIAMDDNGGGGVTEVVTFAATAGTDYYILVDGTSADEDAFSMTVSSAVGDCGSLVSGPAQPLAPTITNGPPQNGTVGVAYNFAFTSTGSPTFSVTSGGLPPGLALSLAGVISGVPTGGDGAGTVTATNGTQPDAQQAFNIVISAPGATAIPTLGAWGAIFLALALMGLALVRMR